MSIPLQNRPTRRRGFTYLELEVSMVLFAIAMGGIIPLSVVHSRQIRRLEDRLQPGQRHYLAPAQTEWERKIGSAAVIQPTAPIIAPEELVIDDGGIGYAQINYETNDWYYWTFSQGYDNDLRFNYYDDVGDTAVWTFNGILPGKYDVLVTYYPYSFLSSDAKYSIFDDTELVKEQKIDQRQTPNGPVIKGVRWKRLATVEIKTSVLRLELIDDDKGYIQIDAARLIPIENEMKVLEIHQPDSDSASALIDIDKVHVK